MHFVLKCIQIEIPCLSHIDTILKLLAPFPRRRNQSCYYGIIGMGSDRRSVKPQMQLGLIKRYWLFAGLGVDCPSVHDSLNFSLSQNAGGIMDVGTISLIPFFLLV